MSNTDRICPVCGFNNNDGTETGKCAGCGVQIDPHPDHDVPAPGCTITEDDEPFVVDDSDRERWPELKGVRAVHRLEYEYGRGIGAEPYGFYVLDSKQAVDMTWFPFVSEHKHHALTREAHENREYRCPTCGCTTAYTTWHQDSAGIVKTQTAYCAGCHYTYMHRREC